MSLDRVSGYGRADCDQLDDAGAYVLRALGDDEYTGYAEHLRTCPTCRREVEALSMVVDTLPIAAPQIAPPAMLKSRIMQTVNAEAELLRAAGPQADRPETSARRRRWRDVFAIRPALAGACACVLIAVGVVGGVVAEGGSGGGRGKSIPTRAIRASVAPGGAHAALEVTGERAAFQLTGMPSPPLGRVYQVWFVRKGSTTAIPTHTLFNVRSDGRATVQIEEPIRGVHQVLVTAEPTGGSSKPSGDPVLAATPA